MEAMGKCRRNDCYHRAFFYVMGITSETRANIDKMFDFQHDWILPEGMHGGWQTSGTVRVCQLLIFGTDTAVNGKVMNIHQMICSAADSHLTLWRASNSVILNIAVTLRQPGSRRSKHDK